MKTVYKVLICFGVCLVALLLPAAGLELLLPAVIALVGFMAAEWGLIWLAPCMLCCAAGFVLGSYDYAAEVPALAFGASRLSLTFAFLLAMLAAALCMRFRVANRYALAAYVCILCIGFYLACGLDSMLKGGAPYDGVIAYFRRMDSELESVLGSAYPASTREGVGAMIALVPDLLMAFCLLYAALTALCIFLFGRMWYRVFHAEPVKMADISEWRLPKSILVGAGVVAACCVLAFLLKLSFAPSLAWTMGFAFVALFAVQGLAYVYFIYRRVHASRGVRVLIWVFLVLFIPYSLTVLAFVGFVEQITNKRGKIVFFEKQLALHQLRQNRLDEYEKYGYVRPDEASHHPAEGGDEPDSNNKEGER